MNPTVGMRISVFWKDDDAFYQGVIAAALPQRRYRVQYDDGDVEDLNLDEEQWSAVLGSAQSEQQNGGNGMKDVPQRKDESFVVQKSIQPHRKTLSARKMDLANVLNHVSVSPSPPERPPFQHAQPPSQPATAPKPQPSTAPKRNGKPAASPSFPLAAANSKAAIPAAAEASTPLVTVVRAPKSAKLSVQKPEIPPEKPPGKPPSENHQTKPLVPSPPPRISRPAPSKSLQKPSPKRPISKIQKSVAAKKNVADYRRRHHSRKSNSTATGAPVSKKLLPPPHQKVSAGPLDDKRVVQIRNPAYTDRHPDHSLPLTTDRIPRRQHAGVIGSAPRPSPNHGHPPPVVRAPFYGSVSRKLLSDKPAVHTQRDSRPVKRIQAPNHQPPSGHTPERVRPSARFSSDSRLSRSEDRFRRPIDPPTNPRSQDRYSKVPSPSKIEQRYREERRWSSKPRNVASSKPLVTISKPITDTAPKKQLLGRQHGHSRESARKQRLKIVAAKFGESVSNPRQPSDRSLGLIQVPSSRDRKQSSPVHSGSSEFRRWPSYCPVDATKSRSLSALGEAGKESSPTKSAATKSAATRSVAKISSPDSQSKKRKPIATPAQPVRYVPVSLPKDEHSKTKRSSQISKSQISKKLEGSNLHVAKHISPRLLDETSASGFTTSSASGLKTDLLPVGQGSSVNKKQAGKVQAAAQNLPDRTVPRGNSTDKPTPLNELLSKVHIASSNGINDKLKNFEGTFRNRLAQITEMTQEVEQQSTQLGHTIDDLKKNVSALKEQASNFLLEPHQQAINADVGHKQRCLAEGQIKIVVTELQDNLRKGLAKDIRANAAFFKTDLARSIQNSIHDVLGDFFSSQRLLAKSSGLSRKRENGDLEQPGEKTGHHKQSKLL